MEEHFKSYEVSLNKHLIFKFGGVKEVSCLFLVCLFCPLTAKKIVG